VVGERQPPPAGLDPEGSLLGSVLLDLEQVGKVGADLQLKAELVGLLGVVVDGEVLAQPVGDQAVPADGDRRVAADLGAGQRPEDAGGADRCRTSWKKKPLSWLGRQSPVRSVTKKVLPSSTISWSCPTVRHR
jgi:hypothetical protein